MKQITEKENFMMYMHGQQTMWVPRYSMAMAADPYSKYPSAVIPACPSFLNERRTPDGGFDIWGVEYTATEETAGATLPIPNQFMFDDIRKWPDTIKAPDISHIDWEALAKKELANIDRENTAVVGNFHVGYFQQLMAFMGFSEGLCAMYEEPEAVMELFQYLADFYVPIVAKFIEYYKPDIVELVDDTATALNPFISLDMYQEMVKPFHYMQNKPAIDNGIPIMYHNCGRVRIRLTTGLRSGSMLGTPRRS